MYPNPQDVLPLPQRPDINQYQMFAGALLEACRSTERAAVQLVIARVHGFETWPAFAAHIEELARPASPVSTFEAAADAIVGGDIATLRQLLDEHPALIHARSTRGHRAMLLHYTAANGVENYRQITPAHIVAITELLLAAGAEVDADMNVYGGGCTTLGLVATSIYPERAGVQEALMQLLLDHGASFDPPGVGNNHSFIRGCLANGRGRAAEFAAARGARLDLEGAAGLGRLDVVKGYFDAGGTLTPAATVEQIHDAFAWACEYGRAPVVEFMLDRGLPVDARLRHSGQTGLHWAALGGHAACVTLLLERKALVNVIDEVHKGTPLNWARFGRNNAAEATRDRYDAVITLLTGAGGVVA